MNDSAKLIAAALLGIGAFNSALLAQGPPRICQKISGTTTETILPRDSAPNDPFGRIGGTVTGNFAGVPNVSKTAVLTTPLAFSANAAFVTPTPISVREVFVTGPGDAVHATGSSIFTVAPGTLAGDATLIASRCPGTPCVVTVTKVIKINGGTGRWAGASGEIRELGLGNLNLSTGQGTFVTFANGELCMPAGVIGGLSNQETQ